MLGLTPNLTLYFFYQAGCPACHAQAKTLIEFETKYPHVSVIRLNTSKRDWSIHGVKATATPTLLLTDGRQALDVREEAQTLKELDKWIKEYE